MDQAGIIRDLLSWLESHLDQPLSLDNVAAKAGYSKWHLQRMFKDITGNAIGAYIRARRLSKAAVALRLTGGRFWISPCNIASTHSRPSPAPSKTVCANAGTLPPCRGLERVRHLPADPSGSLHPAAAGVRLVAG